MSADDRAVVIGSGPNGLAAAIVLARAGVRVTVFEAAPIAGGGLRSDTLTLPGFVHDTCAAVFPMARASPFFRGLESDVEWLDPPVPLAHVLDEKSAVVLARSLDETAAALGEDGPRYRRVVEHFVEREEALFAELLAPLHVPARPALVARFASHALRSADHFARDHFRTERARALFAGCAAHSFLPLSQPASAAIGLVLAISAHARGWPIPAGGAQRIAESLVTVATSLGVEIVTGKRVTCMRDLPKARAYLFDVAPLHLGEIASHLPSAYRERLRRWRYGPAAFKLDWALSAPIPWRAPECRRAITVHVGGTLEDIALAEAQLWKNEAPERPFILIAQPTLIDPSRAPPGCHTAWAYAHVPFASDIDWTDAIEARIETFAPGFRDTILGRSALSPAALEAHDANLVGGHILGGIADLAQLFGRPASPWSPYATPDPAIFICSASTPPGAGVHGMCGQHAARAVLRRRFGAKTRSPSSDLAP